MLSRLEAEGRVKSGRILDTEPEWGWRESCWGRSYSLPTSFLSLIYYGGIDVWTGVSLKEPMVL